MTDISAIIDMATEASTGISNAVGIAKKVRETFGGNKKASLELNGLIIDIQQQLIHAQSNHSAVEHALLELQREISQRDKFEAEMARYSLNEIGQGSIVYTLKNAGGESEPRHHLCTGCHAA